MLPLAALVMQPSMQVTVDIIAKSIIRRRPNHRMRKAKGFLMAANRPERHRSLNCNQGTYLQVIVAEFRPRR